MKELRALSGVDSLASEDNLRLCDRLLLLILGMNLFSLSSY